MFIINMKSKVKSWPIRRNSRNRFNKILLESETKALISFRKPSVGLRKGLKIRMLKSISMWKKSRVKKPLFPNWRRRLENYMKIGNPKFNRFLIYKSKKHWGGSCKVGSRLLYPSNKNSIKKWPQREQSRKSY